MRWVITLIALGFAATPVAQARADDSGSPPFSAAANTSFADRYLTRTRDLVLHAMGFLGVHYKYGGNSPETGFDCSGLVHYVFSQALGLILPRDTQSISHSGEEITRDELQPGDLVFFNTLRQPFSHVGIYLGDQRFIHAPSRGGQVEIVSMADRYWRQRYNGARRISM